MKAEDGFQLWSETYDRKIDDIFALQDEIARAATAALQLKLSAANGATRERVTNAQAYEAFLRAQYFTTRGRDKSSLDNALAYSEQAVRLDDKYAPAWGLRSYVFDTMGDVGLIEPETAFRRAREDAERSIELDPNGPSGHLALAWVQINRDWITLDPLFASSHSYLGFLLYSAGQYEKALASAQKSLELNPQKTYDHFTRGEVFLAQVTCSSPWRKWSRSLDPIGS